jgi:hypothetical protein
MAEETCSHLNAITEVKHPGSGSFKETCFPQRRKVAKKELFHLGFPAVFAPLREILTQTDPLLSTRRN